jgi:hypothetical protein
MNKAETREKMTERNKFFRDTDTKFITLAEFQADVSVELLKIFFEN